MTMRGMRSSIACEFCRRSKIKCKNTGNLEVPCERCFRLGNECIYKPKGHQQNRAASGHIIRQQAPRPEIYQTHHTTNQGKLYYSSYYLSALKLPPKFLIIKVIKIFLSNQYNGVFQFIHKESFLNHYQNIVIDNNYLTTISTREAVEFDPIVLIAILAMCSRFDQSMIEIYGHFNQDELENPEEFEPTFNLQDIDAENDSKSPFGCSNYFTFFARKLIQDVFDKPSIQRVQALTILSNMEWGNENFEASYMFNGLAARMALTLGLHLPGSPCYTRISGNAKYSQSKKAIESEKIRRTMWTIVLLDRISTGGKNRSFFIDINDIKIPLPCYDFEYFSGLTTDYINYFESLHVLETKINNDEDERISTVGYQVIICDIVAKIAQWCSDFGGLEENISPLDKESTISKFLSQIKLVEDSLPSHLKFSVENLNYYLSIDHVENYGYFHCLLFLAKIFLYREILFMKNSNLISTISWWEAIKKLLRCVKDSSNLISTLKSINLVVNSPLTAFETFTNAVICLYIVTFSNEELSKLTPSINSILDIKIEFKKLGETNMEILRKSAWPIGLHYFETLDRIKDSNIKELLSKPEFRRQIHEFGEGILPEMFCPGKSSDEPQEEEEESLPLKDSPDPNHNSQQTESDKPAANINLLDGNNKNDMLQGFGLENWDFFEISTIFPGWNAMNPYHI